VPPIVAVPATMSAPLPAITTLDALAKESGPKSVKTSPPLPK